MVLAVSRFQLEGSFLRGARDLRSQLKREQNKLERRDPWRVAVNHRKGLCRGEIQKKKVL